MKLLPYHNVPVGTRVAYVAVAGLVLWSGLSYLWPTVPAWHHNAINVFREDVDFTTYFSNLGWLQPGEFLLHHGYAEYPVLGLLYVNWPHYLTQSFEAYHWLLWFSNAALLVLSMWLWFGIAKQLELSRGGWWLWLLPSSLYFSLNRFDIFPVALVLLSLYLLAKRHVRLAWVVYGLSIMAKVYPVFLLPFMWQLSRERGGTWGAMITYTLSPIVGLLFGLYAVGGFEAVVVPFMLQFGRAVDYGSLRGVAVQLGLGVSLWSLLWSFGQVLLPVWWGLRTVFSRTPLPYLAAISLAALSLLLLTNLSPFYSNQWWLWVLPFVAWVLPAPERVLALLYDLVNYVQFPLAFELAGKTGGVFALVVAIRGALLVWLLVALWQQLPKGWWRIEPLWVRFGL